MLKFIAYAKFLRVKDWFFIIGLPFLGFFYNRKRFEFSGIFLLFIIASLYFAHGYSINRYFDFKNKELSFPEGEINIRRNVAFSFFLLGLNCIISLFYSKPIFILVILGAVISLLYSSTKLKRNPFFNVAFNSSGFTILFLIGCLANKPISSDVLYLLAYVWIGIISSQIIHLMAHKQIEHNWSFSLVISYKLFYLSLLIWIGWTFVVFSLINNMNRISLATLIFCITQVLIIKLCNRSGLLKDKFLNIRNKFRTLNIIFGVILLVLLLA